MYDLVDIRPKKIAADPLSTQMRSNHVSAAIGGKDQQLNIVNKTPQHTPEALAGSNATTNSIPNSGEIVNPSDENNVCILENCYKTA